MDFYLNIAVLLWWVAALEAARVRSVRLLLIPVCLVLWAICGTRFETGFDWMGYELVLNEMPTLQEILNGQPLRQTTVPVEPLFYAFAVFVKSVGGGLQLIFALVAAFNITVLFLFLRRFSQMPLIVAAAYFSWIFMPLQMGVVRQSISVSLILLALMSFGGLRSWLYLPCTLLAAGFQYSSIIYLPLYWVLTKRVSRKVIVSVLGALLVLYFLKVSLLGGILDVVQLVTPGTFAQKLQIYRQLAPPERSTGALLYALFNVSVFGIWLAFQEEKLPSDRITKVLLNLSYLFCVVQLLSFEFPLLWARIQYVAFPCQVILVSNLLATTRIERRLVALGVASCMSMAVLVVQLSNPLVQLVFVPYRSLIQVEASTDPGDGRRRTDELYERVERQFELMRSEEK